MKNPNQKINKLSDIINAIWELIKLFLDDICLELKELYQILKNNIISWTNSKKLATIFIIGLIIYPLITTYGWSIKKWINYIIYLKNYETTKEELLQGYEYSVIDFYKTYNKKYWTDCYWISEVNVDSNMYEQWWTKRKEKQNCALVNKMQVYPIEIGKLIIDKEKWKATVSWKALVLILDGDKIKSLEYKNFNLWKLIKWEDGYWKINPYWENIEKYK